jgi:hypothetical protein
MVMVDGRGRGFGVQTSVQVGKNLWRDLCCRAVCLFAFIYQAKAGVLTE